MYSRYIGDGIQVESQFSMRDNVFTHIDEQYFIISIKCEIAPVTIN